MATSKKQEVGKTVQKWKPRKCGIVFASYLRPKLTFTMKRFLSLVAFLGSVSLFAQKGDATERPAFPIDEESKLVTYTDVIQVPGVVKDSLYNVAMEWMKEFYVSPSQAIKSQSKEDGVIEIKHQFQLTRTEKGQKVKAAMIEYDMTLQFRDGRFKYTVTKLRVQGPSYFGIEKWINEEQYAKDENVTSYLVQIEEFMLKLTDSLDSELRPEAPKKEEEW